MEQIQLRSCAKINLSLNVLEKRAEDGYHYVDMVMIPISLYDRVHLRRAAGLSVTCDPDVAGPPEANLAYRAAALLQSVTGYQGGAAIQIEKQIPVAGGLAGGSTNAAAVLKGLNHLWGTGLNEQELTALGIRLGSDVPFFVPQRPARVTGIGERLEPICVARPLWFVLATPPVAKSTGNVYRLFDELPSVDRPDVDAMVAALAAGDRKAIGAAMGNVFEAVMLPMHPEIERCRSYMASHGAQGALMSGAGPTVFGLVPDEAEGRRLAAELETQGNRTFVARSEGH